MACGPHPRLFARDEANTGERMSQGYQALTEKEKQTLRLIVCGHDAKSTARQLGLSVHTINERLRVARRKLSVSSSREAARQLLAKEGGGPDFLVGKQMGEAGAAAGVPDHDAPNDGREASTRFAWAIKGVVVMSLILATLALATLHEGPAPSAALTEPTPTGQATAAAPAADSEVLRSAREWLALVGEGDWAASYEATARSFQEMNTLEVWTSVSTEVRSDVGEVVSRTAISQDSVPAPPAGYEMVKFRTSFTNRPNAVETLTLVREGQEWKVAGYYID